MDAQNLDFEDDTFDLIVTRNVTWVMEQPTKAYSEWIRVLQPGGRMINFDENQYLYLFDEDYKKEKERRGEPEYMKKVHNTQIMEELAYKLPLSKMCIRDSLKAADAMDFDDMICKTVELLQKNPDVLEYYHNKFRYFMVDEYQDTNQAQYLLIDLLARHSGNLCVVGDDRCV